MEPIDERGQCSQLAVLGLMVELSLDLVVGLTTPGTMKMKWETEGNGVLTLVDNKATLNFILDLACKLEVSMVETHITGMSWTRGGIGGARNDNNRRFYC